LQVHFETGFEGERLARALSRVQGKRVTANAATAALSRGRAAARHRMYSVALPRLDRHACPVLDRLLGAWRTPPVPEELADRVFDHLEQKCPECSRTMQRYPLPMDLQVTFLEEVADILGIPLGPARLTEPAAVKESADLDTVPTQRAARRAMVAAGVLLLIGISAGAALGTDRGTPPDKSTTPQGRPAASGPGAASPATPTSSSSASPRQAPGAPPQAAAPPGPGATPPDGRRGSSTAGPPAPVPAPPETTDTGTHDGAPQPGVPDCPTSKEILCSGNTLQPDRYLESLNNQYRLYMQADGNLTLLQRNGDAWNPIWATHTGGNPGTRFQMQDDGNAVLVAPGEQAIWATHTEGHPHSLIKIQDDRNVVVYDPTPLPLWSSGTA
jgi:hypothetical protein